MQIETNREKIIVRTSIIGIIVNVLLSACKAVVGIFSNSIAVILDALNNLSDALSSIITLIGTKLALKPADKKHPFGYGRVEYLSALVVSLIVLYAGATSCIESIKKILKPSVPNYSFTSMLLIGSAVFVKIILGLYVKKQGTKASSGSLKASGQDALFDSIISLSTLIAAFIFRCTGKSFESWLGLIISVVIIKSGIELIFETLSQILGERVDASLSKQIKQTICSVDTQIAGAYDLTLNDYGPERYMGSVHIEIPQEWTARKIDEITRKIQAEVFAKHNVLINSVGIYSLEDGNSQIAEFRASIEKIMAKYPALLQMHGFYVDFITKYMSFDVVFSFASKQRKKSLEQFRNEVYDTFPEYKIFIQQDADFSD